MASRERGRERQPREAPKRAPRRQRSDLTGRVLVAVPALVVALALVAQGGAVFAAGMVVLAVLALSELYGLMRRARPVDLAGFLSAAAMILLAHFEGREAVLMGLVAAFPLMFGLALARPSIADLSWGMAVTLFGAVWVGVALAHAVLLRDLDNGAGLVVDVLVGTFVGDTAAYFGGRAFGRLPLAPDLSPNKTVEGLLCGVFGATLAFWAAGLYQDWLSGTDALIIGFLVAVAAPIGDLFESAIKRDLDVKDTGTLFGAHGGVLDRLDAVFFTAVVGYYAALALGIS